MLIPRHCTTVWLWSITIYAAALSGFQKESIDLYLGDANGTEPFLSTQRHQFGKRGLSNNIQLRILCLGASIVYGYPSTDGNGFRYPLRNKLVWGGNPVNMVGSVNAGTMADNQVEAQGGLLIDGVASIAENSIPSKPNLVIIHVGSNDMTYNNNAGFDVANAHNRLGSLIDRLFDAIPGVTVIASTLLPNSNAPNNKNIYNRNIPAMIKTRQNAGRKLVLADMSSYFFSLSDITLDGTHPTDAGFLKMAAVFYQAIEAASLKGWITEPADTGISDVVVAGNTCDKIPGAAIGPYTITDYGTGWPDGNYVHTGVPVDGYLGVGNPAPEGVYWADINGDGTDDYVYISQNLEQGIGVALSNGGNIGAYYRSTTGPGFCLRRGVRFADITGDGRADVCCLAPNGDLYCWTNTPGTEARAPIWVSMGYIKRDTGFVQANVRLAGMDIDGDGRADYVGIVESADSTDFWGWRNSNVDNNPPSHWIPFQGVAFGMPAGLVLSGWKFVDLNGDHRDDLVHVNENGQVTTWINQRGLSHGLGPVWISMGVTHAGSQTPVNVTFGKFMGTGRGDYSVVTGNSNTGNIWIARTQNMDAGGTAVAGDGTRYCDMTGDGSDDYIWISLMGEIRIYGNIHVWGRWNDYGIVYNVHRTRREVYFADFDGDKKCDILLVDKATGATTMLKNNFANGQFFFNNMGIVNAGSTCTAGYGYDLNDLGVRWNDIDGDGRADFLCMEPNGAFTGYFNKGINQMVWVGQIKHTEGRERKNLRLADMDGGGRADLVWLDMTNSAAEMWNNAGVTGQIGDAAAGTSAVRWAFKGQVASGSSGRGSCIQFANIYGVGRADYILVYPVTNRAFAMFNVCTDGGVTPVEPNLPNPPPMTYPIGEPGTTEPPISQVCIGGTGDGGLAGLCSFTCSYGACPSESCTCTALGTTAATRPNWLGIVACEVPGLDAKYGPLCAFACNYGYCPDTCVNDKNICIAARDPGSPVPNEQDDDRLRRLNQQYPGIFWDWIMPGGPGECSHAEINILEEATRVASLMTAWSPENLEDTAFLRYFITDGRLSGRWSSPPENRGHYCNLINNLKQVSGFAKTGHPGKTLQRSRITYSCKPFDGVPNSCNTPGVLAFTSFPPFTDFGSGTMFCNAFWQLRLMASITTGPPKSPADLGDPSLVSFEQALSHEWMHAHVVGYARDILDLRAVIPGQGFREWPIYGSSNCRNFAWALYPNNPNTNTVYNADNYAWTWANRWFARTWGWTSDVDDGSETVPSGEEAILYSMPNLEANLGLPATVSCPASCSDPNGDGSSISCEYYGEYYDDYLVDSGQACDCYEGTCSDSSPSCCGGAGCPTCNCGDSSCDAYSPSCCASGTCLWAITQ